MSRVLRTRTTSPSSVGVRINRSGDERLGLVHFLHSVLHLAAVGRDASDHHWFDDGAAGRLDAHLVTGELPTADRQSSLDGVPIGELYERSTGRCHFITSQTYVLYLPRSSREEIHECLQRSLSIDSTDIHGPRQLISLGGLGRPGESWR